MSKEQLTNGCSPTRTHRSTRAAGATSSRADRPPGARRDRIPVGLGARPHRLGLKCGSGATGSGGVDPAGSTGSSVDLSKINNIPIKGHQARASVTDITIRRLLTLQGTFKPDQIVSAMTYKGQTNTLSMPDHANRIQVSYTPLFGSTQEDLDRDREPAEARAVAASDQPPLADSGAVVPIAPSRYAIKANGLP